MKTAQVNGMTDRSINALLESKDLGEFLNRAFAMTVIQNAEKTKVASLGEAKDKLTELKATQEKTQAQLKQNSQSLEAETTKLDEKMQHRHKKRRRLKRHRKHLHNRQNQLHQRQVHNKQHKQANNQNKNQRNQHHAHRRHLVVRCKWNQRVIHVQSQ